MKSLRFFTTLCLAICIASIAQAQTSIPEMVKEWERAKAYTKEYLDVMPESGYALKPTPEMRSFAEQMLHLAQGNVGLSSNATAKPRIYQGQQLEKMDEFKNKAALTKVVMECYDFVLDGIRTSDLSTWGERVARGNFSETKLAWLNKAFEHQTHHRGQTTIYLRLKGVTPPAEKLF